MKKLKLTRRVFAVTTIAAVAVLAGGFAVFGGMLSSKAADAPEITAIPLSKTNLRDTLSLSGTIYSDKTQNVYSTLNYPVKEIYVKEGDKVTAGDVLAVLDVSELEYEIMLAENSYQSALASASEEELSLMQSREESSYSLQNASLSLEKTRLDYETQQTDLANGTSSKLVTEQKNIDTAAQALENAKTNHELKKKEYENSKLLFEAGAISKTELDTSENAYNTADNDLTSSERLYNNAVNAYNSAKKTLENELQAAKNSMESASVSYWNAQSGLSRAESKSSTGGFSIEGQRISLEKLKSQYESANITAGIDGTITEINAVVGSSPSGIMFVIEDEADLYASISVKEYNLSKVKKGQNAIITTDAIDGGVFEGEVSYISPKAADAGDSTAVEFETHVKLNDADERIKIGMNAFASIITATAQDVYAVSNNMIVTGSGGGKAVYALNNSTVTEVPVSTGLETAVGVEISGELTDGMLIIANPSDTSPGSVVDAKIQETPRNVMRGGGAQQPGAGVQQQGAGSEQQQGAGRPGQSGATEAGNATGGGQTMIRNQGGATGEIPQGGPPPIE